MLQATVKHYWLIDDFVIRILIHNEQQQTIRWCVSSSRICSAGWVSLFRSRVKNQRTSLFSVVAMCLTGIIFLRNYMWLLSYWNANLKNTTWVGDISIFLVLKLGGWRSVSYCLTALSPEEQWSKSADNKPNSAWLLRASIGWRLLLSPELTAQSLNYIWCEGVESQEAAEEARGTVRYWDKRVWHVREQTVFLRKINLPTHVAMTSTWHWIALQLVVIIFALKLS